MSRDRMPQCLRALASLAVTGLVATAAAAIAAPLHLPQATRFTLKNGLPVIVVPTARLPLVDLRLVVRAGAVDDPAGKEGLAHLTASLLTQGAGPRDAGRVADDIAFVGGSLAADAGPEQTIVTCEVLEKDFAVGLELFRDCVVSPAFATDEFERKRAETIGGIASAKDDPDSLADVELLPFLLGQSPLAHPAVGWESSLARITRDDVAAFHARTFRPERALLAVVGDVEPQAVRAALETAFAAWNPESEKRVEHAAADAPDMRGRRVRIIDRPEVTQSQIRIACLGVPRNHPDYFPIVVANAILGASFTSRLVNEIRVNQGLTYWILSRFHMLRDSGMFTITTFTRNEMLRRTIDGTLAEVKKLLDQGPTPEELERAKRYLTGQFPLGLQAPDALAARLVDVEFYRLDPAFLASYGDRVAAVTMEDCRRALKSYVCTDDLRILVVSNAAAASKQLEGLGPVEVKQPR